MIKILFICHGNICPSFEEPHEHGLCGESEKKNTTVLLPIYNMWYFKNIKADNNTINIITQRKTT